MSNVRVLVVRAPGSNCDLETAFAFEQAGAVASRVHVNELVARRHHLSGYHIMAIPGGFTYGDDIAAGRVLANKLKLGLRQDITRFTECGGLIIGICNGFQVMVKAGILPGGSDAGRMSATLAHNDSGRFECRWVHLTVNPDSPCVFTRGIERMYLPVAHTEGKLVAGEALPSASEVLFYTDASGSRDAGYPHNPNGSQADIAGICDDTGRVFALMPHPERHIRPTQHPQWTRLLGRRQGDGVRIFENAVRWARAL